MRQRRRLGAGALATGALIASSFFFPASAEASSPAGSSTQTGSTVVVTPMLRMMVFGDTVGLPLGCSFATSVLSNASGSLSPELTQTVVTCGNISSQGYSLLEQGITQSSSLSSLNTLLDPLIATGANTLTATGTNDAPLLGIFGPTVASSGATVSYFEGS